MQKTTIKHALVAECKLNPYGYKLKFVVTEGKVGDAAKEFGTLTEFDDEDEAYTQFGSVSYIVVREKFLTYGNIAHEVQHLVDDLFAAIGHAPDGGVDEAKSYMAGFIHTFIYKEIAEKGLWIRHDEE